MNISQDSLLIRLADFQYPTNIGHIRREFPNASIPNTMTEEQVRSFGYAPVLEAPEMPVGDVVTEMLPVEVDGAWYRRWNSRSFTAEELGQSVEAQREIRHAEVNAVRDTDLANGFAYTFPNEQVAHIQMRPQDGINLLGLRMKADMLVNAGMASAPMDFRTREDILMELTAAEMVTMTNAALAWSETVYRASWALKDAITHATSVETMPAVPATLLQ